MNQHEAYGLSFEQVSQLTEIATMYTAAGRPTSVEELVSFVFAPTKADWERLAKIRLPEQPLIRRIKWWPLDAFEAIRQFLNKYWIDGAQLFLFLLLCLLAYSVGAGAGWAISKVIMAFAG